MPSEGIESMANRDISNRPGEENTKRDRERKRQKNGKKKKNEIK